MFTEKEIAKIKGQITTIREEEKRNNPIAIANDLARRELPGIVCETINERIEKLKKKLAPQRSTAININSLRIEFQKRCENLTRKMNYTQRETHRAFRAQLLKEYLKELAAYLGSRGIACKVLSSYGSPTSFQILFNETKLEEIIHTSRCSSTHKKYLVDIQAILDYIKLSEERNKQSDDLERTSIPGLREKYKKASQEAMKAKVLNLLEETEKKKGARKSSIFLYAVSLANIARESPEAISVSNEARKLGYWKSLITPEQELELAGDFLTNLEKLLTDVKDIQPTKSYNKEKIVELKIWLNR